MLIPITTCGVLYKHLISTINKNNEDKYCTALSQSQQIANQYLEGIRNIPSQILSNTESASFLDWSLLSDSAVSDKPSAQINIISYIKSFTSSNPLINNIYLYSRSKELFLTSDTTIPMSSYGSFFKIGDMDYYTLKATVLSYFSYNRLYYQTNFHINGIDKNCFFLVTTVPVHEAENITGAILISVDTNKLFETIQEDLPNDGYFYFYDHSNNLIAKSPGAPTLQIGKTKARASKKINNKPYIMYQTTDSNSINCAVAIPAYIVKHDIDKVRIIIALSLLLSCVVCGLLALYFTKLNTKPIEGIVNTLRHYSAGAEDDNNEYTFISKSVNSLISTNVQSKELLENNMPILRSNFLHSILSGDLLNMEDISKNMKDLNIDFDSEYYIMLIASFVLVTSDTSEMTHRTAPLKIFVSEKISLEYKCLHTYISENQTAFAICLPDNEQSVVNLENMLNILADQTFSEFNSKLKFSLSQPFTSISDLFYQYHETKGILEHGIQTVYGNAIWCTKNLLADTGYYYPTDIEKRILYSFQNKNINMVLETLDNILKENNEKRILSAQTLKYLCSDIKCTVFKILYDLNLSSDLITETEELFSDNASQSLPDFIDLVKKRLMKLFEVSNNCSEDNTAALILQYIDKHYNDPALSRLTFSNHFYISESYASKFFKEYTGYQFTEYLTKVRMDAACKLLSGTNYAIDKIAVSVGYNSDVSFRRAFKSYTGMTPKQYRNLHIG